MRICFLKKLYLCSMKKHILKITSLLLLSLMLSMTPVDANAQCPMCRMSAENNLKDGGSTGKGLNKGILYMLVMPYVLVGTIGVVWYRNRKKEEEL